MPPKKRQSGTTNNQVVSDNKRSRHQKPKLQSSLPKLSKKEREQYTVKVPYLQSYSYPLAIIEYISRNPSNLDDHKNLIGSAKSLLRMSRIIPVENVRNCRDDKNKFEADKCRFDLTEKSFDMWVTSYFTVRKFPPRTPFNPYFASTLLKRIYRCTAKMLHLHFQILTFQELKFLFSVDELQHVVLIKIVVKNDVGGSVVEFEKVFETLLKAERMEIAFAPGKHGIGNDTARRMVEMLENEKVRHSLDFKSIPEKFDFATFASFFKTNLTGTQRITHGIDLSFSTAISQTFKNQLQTFFHEIIALVEHHNLTRNRVPLIKFIGHDKLLYEKLQKLKEIRYSRRQLPNM